MLEITSAAGKAMHGLFHEKGKGTVRISLLTGSCGIRFFGVTVAESRRNDQCYEIDGFTYLVAPDIIENYAPIKIDSDGFSFRISGGGIFPPSACGTCAFGCIPREKINCNGVCRRCPTPCATGQRLLAKRKKYLTDSKLHIQP